MTKSIAVVLGLVAVVAISGPAMAFLPVQNGLVSHLRAGAGTGIGPPIVVNWLDQSGNNNDLTQDVANGFGAPMRVAGVLNGRTVVRFGTGGEGVIGDALVNPDGNELPPDADWTLFIVMRSTGYYAPLSTAQAPQEPVGNRAFRFNPHGGGHKIAIGYVGSGEPPLGPIDSNWHVDVVVHDDDTTSFKTGRDSPTLNDSSLAATYEQAALALGRFNFGGTPGWASFEGDIAEVIIFNRELNPTEIDMIGGYLANVRYNLPSDFQWVPEPATMALLGIGGLLVLGRRRAA